jgi:sporulation protein YlmC with PRC-barrel domain
MNYSARRLLGLSVFTSERQNQSPLGIVETITINPGQFVVDGLLIGPYGKKSQQTYIPRESIEQINDREIQVTDILLRKPMGSLRVFGITAWTNAPRVLVGFVYDFYFSRETGIIDTFVIHQIFRTWDVPASSIIKITPKMLLINNDTTIKLKITPLPANQPVN